MKQQASTQLNSFNFKRTIENYYCSLETGVKCKRTLSEIDVYFHYLDATHAHQVNFIRFMYISAQRLWNFGKIENMLWHKFLSASPEEESIPTKRMVHSDPQILYAHSRNIPLILLCYQMELSFVLFRKLKLFLKKFRTIFNILGCTLTNVYFLLKYCVCVIACKIKIK